MASELSRRRFLGTAGTLAAATTGAGLARAAHAAEGENQTSIKVLGICCSPRKGKSTFTSLQVCLEAAEAVADNIEVELIELAGLKINGSAAAGIPLDDGQKDDFPDLIPKLSDPKVAGIIIGTPVYMGNMSSLCKEFLDRCSIFRQGFKFADKVAGVVAVAGGRNGGQELTIRSVHNCLLGLSMIIVGDGPPTGHWGGTVWSGAPGGVSNDEYGMKTVKNLGHRVADVALRLSRGTV
ncbi:MAG: flavodoxin family protein [Thermoguttaceae bacterium]